MTTKQRYKVDTVKLKVDLLGRPLVYQLIINLYQAYKLQNSLMLDKELVYSVVQIQ